MSDNNGYIKAKPWQVVCAPLADGVNNMFFILSMFLSYIRNGRIWNRRCSSGIYRNRNPYV